MDIRVFVNYPTVVDKAEGFCRVDFGDGDIFEMEINDGYALATAGARLDWAIENGVAEYMANQRMKELPTDGASFLDRYWRAYDELQYEEVLAKIKEMIRAGEKELLAQIAMTCGYYEILHDLPHIAENMRKSAGFELAY